MDKETEGSKGGSGLNTGGGVNGIVTNGGGEEIRAVRPEDDKEVGELVEGT